MRSLLPRPVLDSDDPVDAVRSILKRVKHEGDAALFELTKQFDGVDLAGLRVPDRDLDDAAASLAPELRAALDVAVGNVGDFHRRQLRAPELIDRPGITIKAYQRPVKRAGVYVPGGRAQYPSTVVMTVVPAKVAGVEKVVVCVPPSAEFGGVAPSVLGAARLSGADEVYAVGGAQAIGAMAFGTASIQPVDVIAGPGNIYVAIAKREVAGHVGVAAAFAGPSEVVVVADSTANPIYAAIDLIVQAEHGPDGLAWLITWDEAVADAVCAAGETLLETSPRAAEIKATLAATGHAAIVDGPEAAVAVIDAIAPEHLELQVHGAEQLAEQVQNAGAIFCGNYSPASIGDYVAGPSHVLPTYGSARFSSALTVADFQRDHHVISVSEAGLAELGPHAQVLATQEGLTAHADSIGIRLADQR